MSTRRHRNALVNKRLNPSTWSLKEPGIAGLKFIKDEDGDLIAFVTTSVNPNDSDPISPTSTVSNVGVLNSSGTRVDPKTDDPIAHLADAIEIGFTLAKKTTPVFKFLSGYFLTGTAVVRYMTLEQPPGTDYTVPTGKVFYILRVDLVANAVAVGDSIGIGYGDTGVAEGTVAPTAPVILISPVLERNAAELGWLKGTTANVPVSFKTYAEVPAGKLPLAKRGEVNTPWAYHVFGVEVDV